MEANHLAELGALVGASQEERFTAWAGIAHELRDKGEDPPRWQGRIPRIEERAPRLAGSEVRAAAEGILEGEVIVYNAESEDLGGFTETVRKGAATKSLREGDVVALWSHATGSVLGRQSAGTLELRDSSTSLDFRVQLPDSELGRNAWESVRRGDVVGTSFGFHAIVDRWTERENAPAFRELLEMQLLEVSPVAFPAYAEPRVDARACAAWERHRLTCHDSECRCITVRSRDLEAPASLTHRRARLRLLAL